MAENEQDTKRPLSLGARPGAAGRLALGSRPAESGQVRQSFSHGRSKAVTVEVKKKRTFGAPGEPAAPAAEETPAPRVVLPPRPPMPTLPPPLSRMPAPQPEPVVVEATPSPVAVPEPVAPPIAVEIPSEPVAASPIVEAAAPEPLPAPVEIAPPPPVAEAAPAQAARPAVVVRPAPPAPPGRPAPPAGQPARTGQGVRRMSMPKTLTNEERASRMRALQGAIRADEEARRQAEIDAGRRREEEARQKIVDAENARRAAEEAVRRAADDEVRKKNAEEDAKKRKVEEDSRREMAERAGKAAAAKVAALTASGKVKPMEDDEPVRRPAAAPGLARPDLRKPPVQLRTKTDPRRRTTGKMSVTKALSSDEGDRMRSLASVRRARERERQRGMTAEAQPKVVRDVVVPEAITVQELASRMAERGTDVVKVLMRMGVMATINQTIDADTAELVVQEFGHKLRRVAESDVEIGLKGEVDVDENLESRPPVVTIMGHVDHGKTSLLDALRLTDVVSGEAGGITQHIGAYQVKMESGHRLTFIDTPGHQAFTAMRARGANVTDIVVLVVAADDGIKEQTVEAIKHARAAQAPIIVAINKMDKPGANPDRVRQELLQHEIVVEALGGDVLDVEVSALKKTNLDKLEEAILLQAEILDLKSNPNRSAEGTIIEAKLERGRGPVATVLIQRGTLKVGDIFVAGGEWGRVRALIDGHGVNLTEAGPSMPVEVLGLAGVPMAGDELSVVENEGRARDVADFRQRRRRDASAAAGARGTLEQMFSQIAQGVAKELPVVVKSDVQGSLEAIIASLNGLSTDEVAVRLLNSAVGGINESDINLAKASNAAVIAFNVRANPQARELARRDNVEIRYYSIIYDVIDDIRAALSGMLAPTKRENFLGYADIREVFNITKVGKVAGCRITEGVVRRGNKVRLLRNDVVIHEGTLKTLKRFKDEVREVQEGYECGMAFENYENIQVGDRIECFEIEEIARTL